MMHVISSCLSCLEFEFNSLRDLEDPEQSESPEDGEAERTRIVNKVCPADLEHAGQDHDAVEAVEGRLEVDPRAERVHPDDHLRNEQAEEHKLCVI